MDRHLRHFLLAKKDGMLVGVIGLEVLGEFGLLRSLAVTFDHRGKGIGNLLNERMLAYARLQGIKQLYALTLTIEGFLKKRGFHRIERADAPQPLKETEEETGAIKVDRYLETSIKGIYAAGDLLLHRLEG